MSMKFDTALICEDVRIERSGKLSLVGVYAAEIITDRIPAMLMLAFVLVVDIEAAFRCEVGIRLRRDDDVLFEGNGSIEPKTSGRHLLPIGKQLIRIERTGVLRLDAKQTGLNWQTLVTTPLHVAAPVAIRSADFQGLPRRPVRGKSTKREQKPRSPLH